MPKEVAENTTFYKAFWSDLKRQLDTMDTCGIEKALLLYPTSDAHLKMGGWRKVCRAFNEGIASVVKQYPKRFIGGGILPIDSTEAMLEELKRFDGLGLKVISLASSFDGKFLDDEIFIPVFEFAQKKKIPIHIHAQIMNPIGEERVSDPLLTPVLEYIFDVSMCMGKMMMSEMFLKYSDIQFIVAHYGGVLPFVKERFDNTYQMLRKRDYVKDIKKTPGDYFKNLYLDSSGSKSLASLLCALEMVDASHILFGSDFPANQNVKASLDAIWQSPLKESDKESILSNQLLRCL